MQNDEDIQKNGKDMIDVFEKYISVSELSAELLRELVDKIYVYEDKRIVLRFRFEDEYVRLVSKLNSL